MRKIYLLFLILIPLFVDAQDSFVISGKILDDAGRPVEGATVQLAGTPLKSLSTSNGSFQINSPDRAVQLRISFVGFIAQQHTVELPLKSPLLITLQPDLQSLEEVIVSTGYQDISKERVTGSFEQISPALIDRGVSPNILKRIETLSPAILFDNRNHNMNNSTTTTNLLVRGVSSINSDLRPLIVLDNFPYEGDISNINPNDVESITILKDASAASIWGAKAGNGVIVINSKKGGFNKPLAVSATANVNITGKPDLFADRQISSSDLIDVEQFLFSKGFYNSQENNVRKPALSPVVELLIANRDGKISASQLDAQLEILRSRDVRNDFNKYVYREEVNQQYALNLSGGGPTASYLVSAGYDKNLQSLVTNNNDRITIRTENTIKLFRDLQFYGRLTYTGLNRETNNDFSTIGYGQIRPANKDLYTYATLADDSGNPLVLDKDFRGNYIRSAGNGILLDWQYRPLDEIRMADKSSKSMDLLINTGLNYKVTNWLSADIKYQFSNGRQTERDHYSQDTYHVRNLINRYTQISGSQVKRPIPLGGILDQGGSSRTSHSVRGQINVNHSWAALHAITSVIGSEIRDSRSSGSSYRTYGYDDNILTTSNVDLLTSFPAFENLASSATIPSSSSISENIDRFVSFYANASYTFDNRYSLTLSARKDASNLFGVNANQRGIPLGSAGFAWNISNEDFFNLNWLNMLKFRTSYGHSGNTNHTMTAYTTMSYNSPSPINNLRYANLVSAPNADLRWERVKTWNAGIDFAFVGNRLNGSFDYYDKNTDDLFGAEPIDPTTGFGRATINGASTKGKGFELILNSRNLVGMLGWNTNLMFGYNKTVVDRYLNSPSSANFVVGSPLNVSPVQGYIAYPMFSYPYAGVEPATGNPVGYVGGNASTDYSAIVRNTPISELVFHGSAVPLYLGSLRNDFNWKNFTLSANISFRFAYYFRRSSINYSELVNSYSGHSDYALRWQKPGDEKYTSVPSFQYPVVSNRETFYTNSESLTIKGDHIRLADLRLSYDLSRARIPGLPIKNAQIFLFTSDLGILWRANKLGIDPDYGSDGIPPSRSIAAGLRVRM